MDIVGSVCIYRDFYIEFSFMEIIFQFVNNVMNRMYVKQVQFQEFMKK